MYGKYKKKKVFRSGPRMSPTKKAYLAGLRAGKRAAFRGKTRSRRWY